MSVRGLATALLSASAVLAGACQGAGEVASLGPERVAVAPAELTLAPAYVGHEARTSVVLTNLGQVPARGQVRVEPPFLASADSVEVPPGQSVTVTVRWTPGVPGAASSVLRVGALEVPVSGVAEVPPVCVAPAACRRAAFDPGDGLCRESALEDGLACATRCLDGTCAGGVCVGASRACDDSDACTVDGCDEASGCAHVPRECPSPASPCSIARCDPATGCGTTPAADGTPCAVDDCVEDVVSVCVSGQCQRRPRPVEGRCGRQWVSVGLGARDSFAWAVAPERGRLVIFGGIRRTTGPGPGELLGDTWEWDGERWHDVSTVDGPSPRTGAAMAHDRARGKTVLFGGGRFGLEYLGDTWEWDGRSWSQVRAPRGPSARTGSALACGPPARGCLLVGGSRGAIGASPEASFVLDGLAWRLTPPASVVGHRVEAALGVDEVRRKLVLAGGAAEPDGGPVPALEWDGQDWAASGLLPPSFGGVVADGVPGRGLLFSHGVDALRLPLGTYERRDGGWAKLTDDPPPAGRATFVDPRTRRLTSIDLATGAAQVLGAESWESLSPPLGPGASSDLNAFHDAREGKLALVEVDGTRLVHWTWERDRWARRWEGRLTEGLGFLTAAWDSDRQRGVLVGRSFAAEGRTQTWAWDGAAWAEATSGAEPRLETNPGLARDPASGRLLLYGAGARRDETWAWSGQQWTRLDPTARPPASDLLFMATDERRQRVVLLLGRVLGSVNQTWEWDGQRWERRELGSQLGLARAGLMSFEPTVGRVVLRFLSNLEAVPGTFTAEWDGQAWAPVPTAGGPQGGVARAMAYEPLRGRLLLVDRPGTAWYFVP